MYSIILIIIIIMLLMHLSHICHECCCLSQCLYASQFWLLSVYLTCWTIISLLSLLIITHIISTITFSHWHDWSTDFSVMQNSWLISHHMQLWLSISYVISLWNSLHAVSESSATAKQLCQSCRYANSSSCVIQHAAHPSVSLFSTIRTFCHSDIASACDLCHSAIPSPHGPLLIAALPLAPTHPHQNSRVPESPTFKPAYLHRYLSRVIDERIVLLALSSWVRWFLRWWL